MMRKGSVLLAVLGAVVAALGLYLMRGMDGALPGMMIGLGSGALGLGLSGALSPRVARKHPEIAQKKAAAARQKAVEQQDERNVAVLTKAKARAYDMMTYIFGVLVIACALMKVGLAIILMLVGAYLLMLACCVGFLIHYNKSM